MGLWGSPFCLLFQAKISGTFEVKEYLGSGGTFLATKACPSTKVGHRLLPVGFRASVQWGLVA